MARKEAMNKAEYAAKQALQIDDQLAEAHNAYAAVLMKGHWDWDNAGKEFKRAISLNPRSAQSYTLYTHFLGGMGRYDEAQIQGRRALELDPLSVSSYWFLGGTAIYAGRIDEAIQNYSKAIEFDPDKDDINRAKHGVSLRLPPTWTLRRR